jgi:hypothetical protein
MQKYIFILLGKFLSWEAEGITDGFSAHSQVKRGQKIFISCKILK